MLIGIFVTQRKHVAIVTDAAWVPGLYISNNETLERSDVKITPQTDARCRGNRPKARLRKAIDYRAPIRHRLATRREQLDVIGRKQLEPIKVSGSPHGIAASELPDVQD